MGGSQCKCNKRTILVTIVCLAVAAAICIAAALLAGSDYVSYRGDVRLRALTARKENRDFIDEMKSQNSRIEAFYIRYLNAMEMWVKKKDWEFVKSQLKKAGIEYIIFTEDLQESIDQVTREIRQRKLEHTAPGFDPFNFYTYDEVRAYLLKLRNENKLVDIENLGLTYEGRDILLSRVTSRNESVVKPIVYIDCTIHSNEWIASTVCLWVLNELSSKYGKDAEVTRLLDYYDWYIKPLSNPDGYVYAWTTDRLWRKNRTPNKNSTCYETDLNRNFDTTTGSVSELLNPCARIYKGANDFSEAETQATVKVLTQNKNRIKLALFMHCFSQLWLSPYGVTPALPPEYPQMEQVMKKATDAIRSSNSGNGTKYLYGSSATLLYNASGTASDYAYDKLGIVHSYVIELPDEGEFGFVTPVRKIEPTVLETWNGIKAAAFAVMEL